MIGRMLDWLGGHRLEFTLLVIILVIGGILRFYQVGAWMHFGQDEGRDAFLIRSIARDGDVQLLGPAAPSNRPDFHLGPAFYYLLVPFYWLSGYPPAGGALAVASLSFLSIFLVYLVGRLFFNTRVGLIAAALFSVSFVMVYYGRWAWNPNVVPFFILLIFLSLYKLSKQSVNRSNENYIFLLAVCVGVIIQLHGTALMVIPLLLTAYFIIFRPRLPWQKYLLAVLIVLVLNLPSTIYDLTHHFSNAQGFWTVVTQSDNQESVGWLGRLSHTYTLWQNFWQESLLHSRLNVLKLLLFIGSVVFLLGRLGRMVDSRKKDSGLILLGLWFFIPFFVFIFYREFIPTHYFCLVFPLPFLLLAGLLDLFWRQRWTKAAILTMVIGLFSFQLYYSIGLLRDLRPGGSRASSYPVTLTEMKQAVNYIIEDSQGEPFNLTSESYYRSFEYLFDQQGVAVSVTPEKLKYEAVIGGRGGETFGNLSIIKAVD